jgi:hypothetical protein
VYTQVPFSSFFPVVLLPLGEALLEVASLPGFLSFDLSLLPLPAVLPSPAALARERLE